MRRSTFRLIFNAAILSLISYAFVETVEAQATRNLNSAARRIEEFNKQGDNAAREEMNREMRGRKPSAEELRQAKVVNAQIEEDLSALQSGYNEIVMKLQSREEMTNAFIAENAEQINKHGSRLRSLIKFPELKDEKTDATAVSATISTRKQLVELCNHILAFFDSPLFVNPTVLDVGKADAARQVLDDIIQKSGKLKSLPN